MANMLCPQCGRRTQSLCPDCKIEPVKCMQCPCCGYYTIPVIFEICDVCFWQYDEVAHHDPDMDGGANQVSLNQARENYKKFGTSELRFIGQGLTRPPLPEELPENNAD